MLLPTIFKIIEIKNGLLSIMAKPVPGDWLEDQFIGLKKLGVDKIVSLLEESEQIEIGLELEQSFCLKHAIEYVSFPIADRGIPNIELATKFVNDLFVEISDGKHIVIHCRAGIGRTGIIACAILLKLGMTVEESIALISEARGVQVPDTEEQVSWLNKINYLIAD